VKYFFIVGCPRSGTTWLQLMLAQHPAVATTQETHLFSAYLACLQAAWERHRQTPRRIGLQAVFTEEEFRTACVDFATQVMEGIARSNRAAKVVLEKTPSHVHHVPLILQMFPDAYFIHLVRDARAAVASLCAAGRSWGRAWASPDPLDNARVWVRDVSAGRAIADLTEHHVTVKYEALLGPMGGQILGDLFGRMGLEVDDEFCQGVLRQCGINRLRSKGDRLNARAIVDNDPAGFYRKGNTDSWAEELSPQDVRVVEYIAGDLMHEYGYTTVAESGRNHKKPWRLRRRELLTSIEWRVNRTIGALFHKSHQA